LCESNCEAKIQKLLNYSERYNYLTVVCFDMLMALSVLKDMNIIHRDIKSENILVKEGIFKLADLGLCRWCDSGERLTNNVGNRLGRSPEFLSGKYSCKTDVWSLGMHLFYMLENTLPFDE
jgi:serine/threonine protein kinase